MFLQSYLVVVKSISKGLEQAVEECKHQFKWDLWNCPVTASSIVSKSKQQQGKLNIIFINTGTVNRALIMPP